MEPPARIEDTGSKVQHPVLAERQIRQCAGFFLETEAESIRAYQQRTFADTPRKSILQKRIKRDKMESYDGPFHIIIARVSELEIMQKELIKWPPIHANFTDILRR